MGSTRIEQAIDDIDPLVDDAEASCEDIRLAWLASEFEGSRDSSDFEALWNER